MKQRLGTESMRPFDACCLCLKPSVTPVLTKHGYIYCRECILENILVQKKRIKRAKKEYESLLKLQQEEEQLLEYQKQQEQKKQFQQLEDGIGSDSGSNTTNSKTSKVAGGFWAFANSDPSKANNNNNKNQLLNDNNHSNLKSKKPDDQVYDPMCQKPIKMKQLITLHFKEVTKSESNATNQGASNNEHSSHQDTVEYNNRFMCGCCFKTLTNATKGAHCITECGHVICGTCYQSFVQPAINKKQKNKKMIGTQADDKKNQSDSSSNEDQSAIPQCLECAKRILHSPIAIQIAGTVFTQEGKSNEASKYTPSLGYA